MRTLATLVLALALSLPARAAIQRSGPEHFPGSHELALHTGFQVGFGGTFANPSGFKVRAEYGYRFTDLVWLNVQANQLFGFGVFGPCGNRLADPYCGIYLGGWATELAAGVKLKIKTPIPLVVEVPLTAGVEFLYNRYCSDNGAAGPVFRPGAGVHYFLTDRIGLGGGFSFAVGPAFHSATRTCGVRNDFVDFYGAFDFAVGAEFIL